MVVLSFISNKLSYCLLFFFIVPVALFSQKKQELTIQDNFPFTHIEYINSAQGLNGSEVYWATQDRRGFMWFITNIGLNRFDGHSFRSYGYNPDDANSPVTDWHHGMIEDKNGTLWILSQSNGLYSFDPYHEKFINYRHQPGNNNSLAHNRITAMDIEGDSILWMAAPQPVSGLDKFDLKTKSFSHITPEKNDSTGTGITFIYSHVLDKRKKTAGGQGWLWLMDNSGPDENLRFDCFDTKTGKIIDHFDFPFISHLTQYSIRTDGIKNETIWIGSNDNGIYGFNIVTKKFIIIKQEHSCRATRHINEGYWTSYHVVMEDHAGNLWTTNDNNEIVYYDRTGKKFYSQPIQKIKANFVPPPFIFEDKSERVWLCTTNGLIAVDTKQKNIFVCQHNDNDTKSISGNLIYGIKRVKNGPLFIESDDAINSFNKKTKSFSRFPLTDNGKKIENGGAWIIYEDSRNNIWFTGGNTGLICYNPTTKKSRLYKFFYADDGSEYSSWGCQGIIEDRKGRYWVTGWSVGLYSLDPATGKVRIFSADDKPNSLTTNDVATLFEDSKGILYMCGWGGGFITFNPDNETFKTYHHDPKDPTSVSHETSHSFLETKNGLIWFGTIGGGINVFNPATGKFKAFTTQDGLAHDNVCTLIEDKNGNYWAGTTGGISCFTMPDDPFAPGCKIKFRNYDMNDGLPSNQLNWSSAFCDTDGTLYFGTRGQGLFYFHPDSLKDNDFKPPVYITEFRLKNKLVGVNNSISVLSSPIEFTKEIRLNYKQNMISFSFAALNYTHPEKNQYAYMLEGFDKNWIYTDASKRFANYTNLDPDTYVFKVKATNNDGVWNETPTELKIIITPPFWQTAWFRVLVIVAIAGAIYAAYRYRLQQILKLQNVRNRIAADLHDDIGSTLNSISVFSEVAKTDSSKRDHSLNMIGESSRKVIDAMSDIVWTINPDNDSFEKIILKMRSIAYNLLRAKKIEFTFRADEKLNELKLSLITRRNFYFIFKEALNNLIKYSQAKRVSVSLNRNSNTISLVVRDDGIGFDPEKKYNGNGLTNIRRRAKEINAQLNIESGEGEGTSIQLNLKT